MNDKLKTSIRKFKKLQVGSIVSVEAYGEIQHFTVAEITPCKWQHNKEDSTEDICFQGRYQQIVDSIVILKKGLRNNISEELNEEFITLEEFEI